MVVYSNDKFCFLGNTKHFLFSSINFFLIRLIFAKLNHIFSKHKREFVPFYFYALLNTLVMSSYCCVAAPFAQELKKSKVDIKKLFSRLLNSLLL